MTYLVGIFVYLLVLTGISIYKSRQVRTQEDFAVAGRSLSPWIMVCTMLAVWIGTGSIVGNAGKAYQVGMAAFFLPVGTFIGMILLSFIATRVRNIEALSVPEIIGRRFGAAARMLAVIALIIAYMVIVSYQFNAGGMILEVITGKKDKVILDVNDTVTKNQVRKGYFQYEPPKDWTGTARISFNVRDRESGKWSQTDKSFTIEVGPPSEVIQLRKTFNNLIKSLEQKVQSDANAAEEIRSQLETAKNTNIIKENTLARVEIQGHDAGFKKHDAVYRLAEIPHQGQIYLHEPKLTAGSATIIAAVFIIAYTMLAGLLSLAFSDIVTGIIITVTLLITFPVLLMKAGGLGGMAGLCGHGRPPG